MLAVSSISALDLTLNNPIDGSLHNSRYIDFDLNTDVPATFYITKNIYLPEGWRTLCRDTTDCVKKVRLNEGENRVLLKAVTRDGTTETLEPISFNVDTVIPRVNSVYPRLRALTNGDLFVVKYTEENLEGITLHYGSDSITKTDCVPGRNMKCSFENVDLSSYDGEDLEYWFEVEDMSGNIVASRKRLITADTSKPVLHHFEYQVERRRVSFVFEIEEDNFKSVLYKDDSEIRPVWRPLCTRAENGRCFSKKSMTPGSHLIDILIEDKAGNELEVVNDEMIFI